MNVVSIDPAPSKNAVIFDGKFNEKSACELPDYCDSLTRHDTILCWDAPLTGPPLVGRNRYSASYSQRIIERFFSRTSTGFKTPAGISVLPYSGCPHWAITRASVGYPLVGKFDAEKDLPFRLVVDGDFDRKTGLWIIESHPAVAIWLWCASAYNTNETWVYKGRTPSRTIEDLWEILKTKWHVFDIAEINSVIDSMEAPPKNDDELDAVVGWVLGMMLVYQKPLNRSVTILGNRHTGAIALPVVDGLEQSFEQFCNLKENAT